jgi:hypothetical protein
VWQWAEGLLYTTGVLLSGCLERALSDTAWDELQDVNISNPLAWPLRHEGRPLGLVIRRWAEGADSVGADAGLARRLLAHPEWGRLVALQRALEMDRDLAPADFARRWGLPLPRGAVLDPMFFQPTDEGILFRLRQAGLPATQRTVQFLRAAAEGRADALPGRGLLVASFVFMIRGEDGRFTFHDGNPSFEVSGQHEFARKEQLLKAYEVASKHREWLGRFALHPLTTRQAVAAALPTALSRAADLVLDYEREALDPANLAGLRRRLRAGTLNRQAAIRRYLDEAYERTRKRRERAGQDARPPQGWRKRAYAAIVAQIDRAR